jgi:hypothetical protein
VPLEYKEVLLIPSLHTCQVSNHSKQIKNEEDTRLELMRGLGLFQKTWNKLLLILFLCSLHCCLLDSQRTFVTLQFELSMTQKLLNLLKEWVKYWIVFDDKYVFNYEQFYQRVKELVYNKLHLPKWEYHKVRLRYVMSSIFHNEAPKRPCDLRLHVPSWLLTLSCYFGISRFSSVDLW